MFEIGDYIVYGNSGVCRVDKVGMIDNINGIPKDKLYYTLSPIYLKGSTVYTSVDNQRVIMRPVISEKEARDLIDHIKDVEVLWIPDEKGREEAYQTALNTCNCEELVKIIKTLYVRNESRIADGKKMTNSDRKYLKLAEEFLYGELALPLGIEKSEVEAFIIEKCDLQQEETTWKVKEQ